MRNIEAALDKFVEAHTRIIDEILAGNIKQYLLRDNIEVNLQW